MRVRRRLPLSALLVAASTAVAGAVAVPSAVAAPPGGGEPAAGRPGGKVAASSHSVQPCTSQTSVEVPGAQRLLVACLPDLTTSYLTTQEPGRYTDQADWVTLHMAGTSSPTGVPGVQLDGHFADTSRLNTTHGWNSDAQFVIRLPDDWNGGLVVTGAPGNRKQYSNDFIISDWVVAQGFAFASTDKGNNGPNFYTDGQRPGDALAEWHERVTQLTRAAKAAVKSRYGHRPRHTIMTGISNGGYLTRWQLENRPGLYDGGVDWEGTLIAANGPDLFDYLPTAVAYTLGEATTQDMLDVGFPPDTDGLWAYHRTVYWGLTQKLYRAEFDPTYDPTCPGPSLVVDPAFAWLAPCPSDATYDLADRPREVQKAVARVGLTGKLKRPLITLHGTYDTLLPISQNADAYAEMVEARNRDRLHRYYVIEGGNHVDSLVKPDSTTLRPILPCYREAFDALVEWVTERTAPPPDAVVERPAGPASGLRESCSLT